MSKNQYMSGTIRQQLLNKEIFPVPPKPAGRKKNTDNLTEEQKRISALNTDYQNNVRKAYKKLVAEGKAEKLDWMKS